MYSISLIGSAVRTIISPSSWADLKLRGEAICQDNRAVSDRAGPLSPNHQSDAAHGHWRQAVQRDIPGQDRKTRQGLILSISYRFLEAFHIWSQDWIVDARKLLNALQDFRVVSHLGAKEAKS